MTTDHSAHEWNHMTDRLYGPEVRANAALWTARMYGVAGAEQLGERFNEIEARVAALEANAAPTEAPSSPANAPEVPQCQTGDSDGTERNRVTEQNSPVMVDGVLDTPAAPATPDQARQLTALAHQTYGVIELRAALRVWRKVQACEVHDGVMIRTASGGIVRYNSAPSLLAWLKDGEA